MKVKPLYFILDLHVADISTESDLQEVYLEELLCRIEKRSRQGMPAYCSADLRLVKEREGTLRTKGLRLQRSVEKVSAKPAGGPRAKIIC